MERMSLSAADARKEANRARHASHVRVILDLDHPCHNLCCSRVCMVDST